MSVFRTCLTYAHFFSNQGYIATELCEQREIVDNSCEGHCQLQKELSKQSEQSDQNTPNSRIVIKENLHNTVELFQFDFALGSDLIINPASFSFNIKTHFSTPDTPPPRSV